MKKVFIILFILIFQKTPAYAIYDPLSVPNNRYGIHIIDENDLENAATLVNSSNGDWGYVTMVIREDDRNENKWQATFKRLDQYHLIPIIRLATKSMGNAWSKPKEEEILPWVNFLNGLKWPVKNRYVILFNEPNHAKEYENTVDPEHYANIVLKYSGALKEKSDDFFVMMAGFDASAPNSTETMDEADYLKRMINALPDMQNHIDGWVSHSYPNPGFSGNIKGRGRGTLTTYIWEKEFLKGLGIDKIMPIFITETGWVHNDGDFKSRYFKTADEVANLLITASEEIWNDSDIAAITPFVLNYTTYPFSHFSWALPDGSGFYPQYEAYQSIPKIMGKPVLNTVPSVTITSTGVENIMGIIAEPEPKHTLISDLASVLPNAPLFILNIVQKISK